MAYKRYMDATHPRGVQERKIALTTSGEILMPKKSYDLATETVTITFDDNSTAELSLASYSPEIIRQLALHGLSQKAGDSYAGAAKASEEEGITADEYCQAAVARVDQQLREGNFNAGGGGGVRGGIFVEALTQVTGKSQDDIVALVNSLDEEKVKELKKHPQVKNAMLQIRAARAEKAASAAPQLTL
jgi:hypothetical protein